MCERPCSFKIQIKQYQGFDLGKLNVYSGILRDWDWSNTYG